MKRKGRFVLEAAYLVPLICTLLVAMVYFTLYVHDYAVCAHTALECGVGELCRKGQSEGEMEGKIRAGLEQKLLERLLWMQTPQVEVQVSPFCIHIRVSGTGRGFWGEEIRLEQQLDRITPCEIIRRCRWLKK